MYYKHTCDGKPAGKWKRIKASKFFQDPTLAHLYNIGFIVIKAESTSPKQLAQRKLASELWELTSLIAALERRSTKQPYSLEMKIATLQFKDIAFGLRQRMRNLDKEIK